jgi:hypothetical protein
MIVKVTCDFLIGELLLATRNVQDSKGNWLNRIINISSLNRNIGEDKSYEISGMSIELNDCDRFFRKMMSGDNRYIAGRWVKLEDENGSLLYTGTVEKWQFQEDTFVLTINDKLSGLESLVTENLSRDQYPDMVDKANGRSIPLIYGDLYAPGGAVKCWRVETGRFLLAAHLCKALVGDVYEEDGTVVGGTVSLDNAADGKAYILCSSQQDFVFANVQGKTDGQGNLIEDPIDAIIDIVSVHAGMSYDSGSMETARAIMANRGYKIACAIDTQKNLQDVLVDFSFSFDCDFYIGKGNEVVISLLNWSQLQPVKSFDRESIIGFRVDELPDEIRNKIQYAYEYNFGRQEFLQMPLYTKEGSLQNWGEFYNRNETLDMKYVYDDDVAFDVVQRYAIQRENPRRVAQVELPLREFSGLDIADIIEIDHPGAIDTNKRKYQIRRVGIDFMTDTVQVEAVDITTLAGGVFVLGNEDLLAPRWELAEDNDRSFGYLADVVSGYFANGTDYGKVLY